MKLTWPNNKSLVPMTMGAANNASRQRFGDGSGAGYFKTVDVHLNVVRAKLLD